MKKALFFLALLMTVAACSDGVRQTMPDADTARTDADASLCDEGALRCNDTEQVEKCVGGAWTLWDDCAKLDMLCVVREGTAQCYETAPDDMTDNETADEDTDDDETVADDGEFPDLVEEEPDTVDATSDANDEAPDAIDDGQPDATDETPDVLDDAALPDGDGADVSSDVSDEQPDLSDDDTVDDGALPDDDAVWPVCTPATYTETYFDLGTHTDTMRVNGTLSVAEDYTAWTTKYESTDVPENDGWTENAPSGWTTKSVSAGVLHLSSVGTNAVANYTRNTSFNNSTGNIVEAKMQLVSNEGGYGCVLNIENGTKNLTFRFFSDHIDEDGSGLSATFDTTTSINAYRVTQQNNDFYLYANGSLIINGAGQSLGGSTSNRVIFNDNATTNDNESYWDSIYYYEGGSVLPKKASGNYLSERIDTGTASNDIGTGATVTWNGTGTGTTLDIYASDGTAIPGTACATGLSTSGATIPGTCDGRYVWIRTHLNNSDATLQDFTLNYCVMPPTCTPHTYTDTDFFSGIKNDSTAFNSTLSVAEDYTAWTTKYEGDVLPENTGWTENAPSGWTTKSIGGSGVLHLSSVGIDANANYQRAQSFDNTAGYMVETKMQLVTNEGTNGCSLTVDSATRLLRLRFFSDHIEESGSGLTGTIDTTSSSNTYRITQKNNDFKLYANGSLLIDGTGASTGSGTTNGIIFHDYSGANDGDAYWDSIYSYNGGDALPKKTSGDYLSERIDTGTTSNDIGAGATVTWNGTNVTMDVYASNDPTIPSDPCATGLSDSVGSLIPDTCTGRYVWIRANLNSSDATLQDFTLNYCTE